MKQEGNYGLNVPDDIKHRADVTIALALIENLVKKGMLSEECFLKIKEDAEQMLEEDELEPEETMVINL